MNKRTKLLLIGGSLAVTGLGFTGLALAGIEKHQHRHNHHMKLPMVDSNKDGMISKDEVLAKISERFDALDSDQDGTISPAEFSARSLAMFTRFDANNDGMLNAEELPKHRHKKRHKGHHGHGDGHSGGHSDGHSHKTSAMDTGTPQAGAAYERGVLSDVLHLPPAAATSPTNS